MREESEKLPQKDDPASLDLPPTIVGGTAPSRVELKREKIGHYDLSEVIGSGGQGQVYLATDKNLNRKVALKVLNDAQSMSTGARIRFEREAGAAGRLNHPNIARVYEIDEDDGISYIAMEFVEGQTLAQVIADSKLADSSDRQITEVQIHSVAATKDDSGSNAGSSAKRLSSTAAEALKNSAQFIATAAHALHTAHEAGLIHRDVKPANLMVRTDGSPCVLDFGLAKDEEKNDMTLTHSGDLVGTPAYMSPEQVRADHTQIDRRTDIYSLGVTLYEACTLERPFKGKTRFEIYNAITKSEPRDPRALNKKIPKDLANIILTAIDKDRDRRYPTALEFALDLERFLAFEPISAEPAGVVVKTTRWIQRNRAVAFLWLALFAASLVAAFVSYFKNEEAETAKLKSLQAAKTATLVSGQRSAALANLDLALAAEEQERAAKKLALQQKEEALETKTIALKEYQDLSDVKRMQGAFREADNLYPVGEALIPRLEQWLEDHSALADRLEGHRQKLNELNAIARPYTEEDRKRDFARSYHLIEIDVVRIEEFEAQLAKSKNPFEIKRLKALIAEFEAGIKKMREHIKNGRKTWDFGTDSTLAFRHNVMRGLVRNFEQFVDPEKGDLQLIKNRLKQSREIRSNTVTNHQAAWDACIERVKLNPRYEDADLKPQVGLIPIGPDPQSGLEEFLHFLTNNGPIPKTDRKQSVVMTKELGLIFVLVPSASYVMGRQASDPSLPHYHPRAGKHEIPPQEVTIAPYLLSKFEMTQGQWLRAFGKNPSRYGDGFTHDVKVKSVDLSHPVENVSWHGFDLHLKRLGLQMPSEAEWEYAASGGNPESTWSGTSSLYDLGLFGNLRASNETVLVDGKKVVRIDDGFLVHAPVGSFKPNEFGFYDMSGNVFEWCFCGLYPYGGEFNERGIRGDNKISFYRILRGGSMNSPAQWLRVCERNAGPPEHFSWDKGIRPSFPWQ